MKALTPEEVALAAFLHDVGKFWWPASGGRRPEAVNTWLDFLPHNRSGRPTHIHAAYSAAFVSQFVCGEDDQMLAATVARHHKPSTREDWIVAVADRLASGERQFADPETPLPDPGQARIASPFVEGYFLPLMRRSLCADQSLTEKFHPTRQHQHEPQEIVHSWEAFTRDVDSLGTPLTDLRSWLELFREHTTRVPAQSPTTKGHYRPSVSIYDHSRVSAALAHILAKSSLDDSEIQFLPNKKDPAIKPFSLLIGDLSGIQPFLYTGATARAVRALKGRSFFLQFLTERFSLSVIEHLGLTPFAELYAGGGRFVLITPSQPKKAELRQKVEQILLDCLGGQIGFAISTEDFGPYDLSAENSGMGAVFKRAGQSLSQEKRRRYRTIAAQSYNDIFGANEIVEECSVCGQPIQQRTDDNLCQLCDAFINLGTRLRKAEFLIEYLPDLTHPLSAIGRAVEPIKEISADLIKKHIKNRGHICQLNSFNTVELARISEFVSSGTHITVGSKLMSARTPEDPVDQTVIPFEELAQMSNGDKNHIAIVRADVDDLGALFHEVRTLSELASLSRAITDFFDGRVTAVMGDKNLKDKIYLVYAGGDDLLFAGAWDAAIDAARLIRDEFVRYTSGRCSLSAGIELVHPRFPLRRSADAAGIAENKAKNLRNEKDVVCLMGVPLPWEDFMRVKKLIEMIEAEISEGSPRRLIGRLREIWWAYEKGKQELAAQGITEASLEKAVRWHRWRWILVYALRMDAGKRASAIQSELLDNGMEKYLGLMARWAELTTRR